ncbi:MAG: long-chain fatty acid--CoA ligase [Thermoanaerobaculia bacterium]
MAAAPWLEHYDSDVPANIGAYPEKTLLDFLAGHAAGQPDQPAILFKGTAMSWKELEEASDAFARSLTRLGVQRGERVALLLPNSPQFLIAEIGAWKCGAIVVPQNPIYSERELRESLSTSDPETIVVLTPFYQRVKSIQSKTTVRRVIATNIKEYLPPLLGFLFTLFMERKEGHRIELRHGDFWFRDLLAEGRTDSTPLEKPGPDDEAIILMSGGTTGTPKGVLGTHRGFVQAGTQVTTWLRKALEGSRNRVFLPLPLFHTYACTGAQSIAMIGGMPLILIPNPRDMRDLLKTIDRERPSFLCGVPTLFNAMLKHPLVRKKKIDFSSIRVCFSGASALMNETKRRFEEITGGRIVEGYSLTEATMACCINPFEGENKIGSVGMPLPDVEVLIVDADDGSKLLPIGETGEIVMRAPQLMPGYWENEEETATMLRPAPDGLLSLYTGDLGYLDEDGYLFIVDRKKDLIKTSGYQVWPREIEEVVSSHPAVAEVGVAGVPDARKGEAIKAWVVLLPHAAPVGEDALRSYCRERLAPYKVPSFIEFRDELPKSLVGKVLRRVLAAEAREASDI